MQRLAEKKASLEEKKDEGEVKEGRAAMSGGDDERTDDDGGRSSRGTRFTGFYDLTAVLTHKVEAPTAVTTCLG